MFVEPTRAMVTVDVNTGKDTVRLRRRSKGEPRGQRVPSPAPYVCGGWAVKSLLDFVSMSKATPPRRSNNALRASGSQADQLSKRHSGWLDANGTCLKSSASAKECH